MSVWGNDRSVNTSALAAGYNKQKQAEGAARQGVEIASQSAGTMRSDADSMRGSARLVNTEAGKVSAEADALRALIPQLDPYKDKLTNYGDTLAAIAQQSQTRADDVFGQAAALSSLDPNATGQAAEYMKHYDLLSPDRYVSRAASDAQSSIDNTRAQTERYLARRGVNIGSGANAGLMDSLQRVKEAALLSAAKTLGRQKGIDEQGNWLKEMTSAAKTFYDMGTQQQSQSMTALGQAGDMAKGAAGIVAQKGEMTQNVGAMRATAAELFNKGASIFGSAAGVEGNAAGLELSALSALQTAAQNAAQYYQTVAMNELAADSRIQAALVQQSPVTNNYKIDLGGNAVPA